MVDVIPGRPSPGPAFMSSIRSAAFVLALIPLAACGGDGGDPSYDTSVARPAYASEHPRIAFDEGHRERHKRGGTYRPLAELLGNDGYDVGRIDATITEKRLARCRVLVVACAQGEGEAKDGPAFTPEECTAIERWVGSGGALLLVTDAFPLGSPVESLGKAFGIEMSLGRTADAIQYDRYDADDTRLEFSRENHLLASHPITEGRSAEERVNRVVTFTGQSVRGPRGSAVILKHGGTATLRDARPRVDGKAADGKAVVEYDAEKSAEGWGQGVALLYGRGRVFVLGDSEVLTALLDGKKKIGMNAQGNDDRKLALNVFHWLSGLLPGA
jgi:hypothetical protein